jgi:predicted kinase
MDLLNENNPLDNKTLDKLNLKDVEIIAVNFHTPIGTCIARNSFRRGREKVPEDSLRRMFNNFVPATRREKYKYKEIIEVR